MKIGFDLDKVFVNTPPFIPESIVARLYGRKTNGVLYYRIPSKPEQILRYLSHYPLFRPPIRKNLQFLRSIPKDTHRLFLISSRFGFLKKNTERLITLHNLRRVFDELHFNYSNQQPHLFKTERIKKLQIDKYIDDDLLLLKHIASKNNHVKLYWFNKKLHKNISNNIRAITNLSAIFDD